MKDISPSAALVLLIVGIVIIGSLGISTTVPEASREQYLRIVETGTTALFAMLAMTRKTPDTQQVEVMNKKADPLPVEQVKEEDTGR
jgi:hypothetical protein